MNRRSFILSSVVFSNSLIFASEKKDIFLNKDEFNTLKSLNYRLKKIKKYVGYTNFNLISYSQALAQAKNHSFIGDFLKSELDLMDKLFYENQKQYGFFGDQTCFNINNKINIKDVVKIKDSGHYIYKGIPEKKYNNLINDIGNTIILTSGVRNVIKQMSLYVNKLEKCNGNITKASISIAPPGYSYHSLYDFDIGKKGLGAYNFTSKFARTSEYKEIRKLDYIGIRYHLANNDGVRFEPWHIKVI